MGTEDFLQKDATFTKLLETRIKNNQFECVIYLQSAPVTISGQISQIFQ